jgi:hypothetical protein
MGRSHLIYTPIFKNATITEIKKWLYTVKYLLRVSWQFLSLRISVFCETVHQNEFGSFKNVLCFCSSELLLLLLPDLLCLFPSKESVSWCSVSTELA